MCDLPPGTSKWNKIKHRLLSHITLNWLCMPLPSYEVMSEAIAVTTSRTGRTVQAELVNGEYPTIAGCPMPLLRSKSYRRQLLNTGYT